MVLIVMKNVETDWDKLISIFAAKFNENEWDQVLKNIKLVSRSIEGVPQDTLSVLVALFGEDRGVQWLYYDKTYRNEPIINFLRTYAWR